MTEPRAREHVCALERIAHARDLHLLVVAAHPDDETIGAGATLGALTAVGAHVEVLHATDGAPRDVTLRPTLREHSRAGAAKVRVAELEAALRAGGLEPRVVMRACLGVPDQEAALALAVITRALAAHLTACVRPVDVVLTHAYEGGHPDHDAVAFAVHAAVLLHARENPRGSSGVRPPLVAEMSSYHAASGALSAATFIPHPELPCARRHEGRLDDEARARKRAMLDAFASQNDVLAIFDTVAEPLRCAPRYDFSRPPHDGTLHYERLPFGWTSERWCELAGDAVRELGLIPTRA